MSWLNLALEALEAHGHRVDTNPGVVVRGTEFLVPIDGRLRSESEIYDELAAPIDADTFVFEDSVRLPPRLTQTVKTQLTVR